jgi:hypothetical protein
MDRDATIRRRLITVFIVSGLLGVVVALVGVLAIVGYHRGQYQLDNRSEPSTRTESTTSRSDADAISAHSITVVTEGNMMTREFTITFRAPVEDIRSWLAASPGIDVADIPTDEPTYTLTPTLQDATFGEVAVDEFTHTVIIHTYWS